MTDFLSVNVVPKQDQVHDIVLINYKIERTHIMLQLFHASTASPLLCVVMSGVALFNVTVLHSDNSFEVFVDQNLVNSGNLLEDMRSLSVSYLFLDL